MSVLQSFFQLLKVIPPYGYIFIYPSSADRHLSCLHFFAKLWIIWTYVSSLLSGTSGSYNQSMLIDWPPNCFPKRLHYFSFPPAMNEGSNFSTCLSSYWWSLLYLLWWMWDSISLGFDLHFFIMNNDDEHLFMCLLVICIYSFMYIFNSKYYEYSWDYEVHIFQFCSLFPRLCYIFSAIPIKITVCFFAEMYKLILNSRNLKQLKQSREYRHLSSTESSDI